MRPDAGAPKGRRFPLRVSGASAHTRRSPWRGRRCSVTCLFPIGNSTSAACLPLFLLRRGGSTSATHTRPLEGTRPVRRLPHVGGGVPTTADLRRGAASASPLPVTPAASHARPTASILRFCGLSCRRRRLRDTGKAHGKNGRGEESEQATWRRRGGSKGNTTNSRTHIQTHTNTHTGTQTNMRTHAVPPARRKQG